MDYNDLCRELKRLIQDNSEDPNPQLFEWVSIAEKQLRSLKINLGLPNDASNLEEWDDEENPNVTENVKRLKQIQAEKKRLLNELSEQAGIRLTNNNPGIANLGDDNRPSKISERFSELYDNNWTDAMEALDGHQFDEKESVEVLVDTLKVINKECTEKREKRLQEFISLAFHIDIHEIESQETNNLYQNVHVGNSTVSTSDKSVNDIINTEELKLLCYRYLSQKDVNLCQDKTVKEDMHKALHQHFKDEKRQNALKHKSVKHYIDKCFEVCWSISLQIPPVVMVYNTQNVDLFRPYTRSGDVIEYIVWPSLLLHENGPLLYKGVAQMTDNRTSTAIYENAQK